MTSSCLTRIFGTLALWMAAVFVGLLLFGELSLETLFVFSFIGLLIVMQLFAPVEQRPSWWRYLRVAAAVGFVIFGVILYQHITAVL